jgi:hypothetical protein
LGGGREEKKRGKRSDRAKHAAIDERLKEIDKRREARILDVIADPRKHRLELSASPFFQGSQYNPIEYAGAIVRFLRQPLLAVAVVDGQWWVGGGGG